MLSYFAGKMAEFPLCSGCVRTESVVARKIFEETARRRHCRAKQKKNNFFRFLVEMMYSHSWASLSRDVLWLKTFLALLWLGSSMAGVNWDFCEDFKYGLPLIIGEVLPKLGLGSWGGIWADYKRVGMTVLARLWQEALWVSWELRNAEWKEIVMR